MALPALWTEPSLLAAMEAELESVSAVLGLDDLDVLSTAVTDVAAVLGVSSVADVSYSAVATVVKVRVIGAWLAWQKAYDVAIAKFDLRAGTADLKLSQIFDHIRMRLMLAQTAASVYPEVAAVINGAGSTAYVTSLGTANSPYAYSPYGNEWS